MFCDKCGAQLRDGAAFCSKCGCKINIESHDSRKKKPHTGLIIFAVSAALLIILVLAGNRMYSSYFPANSNYSIDSEMSGDIAPVDGGHSDSEIATDNEDTTIDEETSAASSDEEKEDDKAPEEKPIAEKPITEKPADEDKNVSSAGQTDKENSSGSINDIKDINSICSRKAKAETTIKACFYDVNSNKNPYDVTWDYGESYNKLIAKCDWNLVFDAAYYKEAFPNLALQYHDNDELLLRHFQTVGVHDGRQGNADFNVEVYKNNCDKKISSAFRENYAAYYMYYMLYNKTQKTVDTKPLNDSPKICKVTLTYLQAKELDLVNNKYRKEVNANPVQPYAELNALAEYRAYLNAHDNIDAHDWTDANMNTMCKYLENASGSKYGKENNIRNLNASKGPTYNDRYADYYATCEAHYEAMTYAKDKSIGISNEAWSSELGFSEQFDIFGFN